MAQFTIGNKAAEKWSEEDAILAIELMRQKAEDDPNVLCLNDAIRAAGLYTSSLNYLVDKYPVLVDIKKDIQQAIISKVNRAALRGERAGGFSATASIWRMKQCGETDRSEQDIRHSVNINPKEWIE